MIFRFERADNVSDSIGVHLPDGSVHELSDESPSVETDNVDTAGELRALEQLHELDAVPSGDEQNPEDALAAVEAHNAAVLAAREQASVPGDDARTAQEQHEPEVGAEQAVPPSVEHDVADESSGDDESSDEEVYE